MQVFLKIIFILQLCKKLRSYAQKQCYGSDPHKKRLDSDPYSTSNIFTIQDLLNKFVMDLDWQLCIGTDIQFFGSGTP